MFSDTDQMAVHLLCRPSSVLIALIKCRQGFEGKVVKQHPVKVNICGKTDQLNFVRAFVCRAHTHRCKQHVCLLSDFQVSQSHMFSIMRFLLQSTILLLAAGLLMFFQMSSRQHGASASAAATQTPALCKLGLHLLFWMHA